MTIPSNKAHTLDEVEKIIRQQEYKFICLMNRDGKTIVPYNWKAGKNKSVSSPQKFAEIKKRWKVLPDDIYIVHAKMTMNSKVQSDEYPIIKGNAPPLEVRKEKEVISVIQQLGDPNKVMTYEEALKLVTETEKLRAQVTSLQNSYNDLKEDYDELQNEFDEQEEKPLNEGNGLQKWANETLPTFVPIFDRYFDIQERKLKLQEVQQAGKFMKEGLIKSPNGNAKRIPKPGTEEFERYLDRLERLTEEQFKAETDYLNKNYPDIYQVVYDEFNQEEEEEQKTIEIKPKENNQ